jgi:hypothetical protein
MFPSTKNTTPFWYSKNVKVEDKLSYPFGSILGSVSKGEYRYGMNTQEKDNEIYGEGNSYSAEYWQYDARLGRRWNVDPRDVPSFSPYSCFANNPLWFSDVAGDSAVGSSSPTQAEVQNRDSPYQFAKRNDITPQQLIAWNKDVFPEGFKQGTWIIHPGQKLNTSDPNQPSSTIENTGGSSGTSLASDFIGSTAYRPNMYFAGSIFNKPPTSISGSNNSGSSLSGLAGLGLVFDGVGGLGTGMVQSGGTFRLTNGAYNGNQLSIRHYQSSWTGGSRAQITTYSMTKTGASLGRVGIAGGLILGAYNINNANIQDGRTFGYNTQLATAQTAGGIVGGWAGAKMGAAAGGAIGVGFFGVGAAPGAIIGGIIGGIGGSLIGSNSAGAVVNEIHSD